MDPETKTAIAQATAEIERVKTLLLRKSKDQGLQELLKTLNKTFISSLSSVVLDLKEAIRVLKTIGMKGYQIKIPKIPPIKIPKIIIPKPEIEVKIPNIKIPPFEFPKEMKMVGIDHLIKLMTANLKKEGPKRLQQNRDKPIHVLMVDEKGRYFKGFGVPGASPRAVSIKKEVPAGFEQLAITDAATALASIPEKANKAVISIEDKTIRYRDDGNNPTATVGVKVFTGGTIILNSRESLEQFRAIRVGTSDSELNVAYYETK